MRKFLQLLQKYLLKKETDPDLQARENLMRSLFDGDPDKETLERRKKLLIDVARAFEEKRKEDADPALKEANREKRKANIEKRKLQSDDYERKRREKEVHLPKPYLKAFPDPEEVFIQPVEKYAHHLNPLISIDLASVDPNLDGIVHIVSPLEPEDGYVGDGGQDYWGEYLTCNWIGFSLTEDNKYELLGDFRFFALENAAGAANEWLEKHYIREHKSYLDHKKVFEETGQINRIRGRQLSPVAALTQLGGETPGFGLPYIGVKNCSFKCQENDGAPTTKDGRKFRFIACVEGWHYRDFGADNILLFYDPVDRIVLQTFDFS